MSFAILRHGKMKSPVMGCAIAHNQRLGNESMSGEKCNIDPSKSHLNVYFDGEGALGRMRSILPNKHRKDAVVSVEMLLSASPEFFDQMTKDREKLARHPKFLEWVKQSVDWLKQEFGTRLFDVSLHMDESTPHIHGLFVPLTKDGRLSAKEVVNKFEMQRRQTEYHETVSSFGLQRGEDAQTTKRVHIGLKEKKGSGGALNALKEELKSALEYEQFISKKSLQWAKEIEATKDKLALAQAELKKLNQELTETLEKLKSSETVGAEMIVLKKEFSVLKTEAEQRKNDLVVARNELKAYQENDRKDAEFWDRWKDARIVSTASGKVFEVCGNKAAVDLGRGAVGILVVKPGEKILTQQKSRDGLSR